MIDYLTKIGGTKQWEYRPEIKEKVTEFYGSTLNYSRTK